MHFGSDSPFTPRQGCRMLVQQLEASRHLDDATRDAIFLDNAYDLLRVSDTGDR